MRTADAELDDEALRRGGGGSRSRSQLDLRLEDDLANGGRGGGDHLVRPGEGIACQLELGTHGILRVSMVTPSMSVTMRLIGSSRLAVRLAKSAVTRRRRNSLTCDLVTIIFVAGAALAGIAPRRRSIEGLEGGVDGVNRGRGLVGSAGAVAVKMGWSAISRADGWMG